MRFDLLGPTFALGVAVLAGNAAAAKTLQDCRAEYAATKPAPKEVQKRAEFMAACRAATVPPSSASALAAKDTGGNAIHRPTAAELAEERKLKRDMNICIGC